MSIDTTAPAFTAVGDRLAATVAQARAETAAALAQAQDAEARATIAECLAAAGDRRIAELEHENRELRKANESWRIRAEALAPTVELPRYPQPEPARRRRRGRHQ